MRTIFWSFERGTWPYDVAVALIVVFVLLSPRSWFHDRRRWGRRPRPEWCSCAHPTPPAAWRRFAWTRACSLRHVHAPESALEHDLHEAVSKNVETLHSSSFQIVRIEPIRGDDGTVAYYDVSIKP